MNSDQPSNRNLEPTRGVESSELRGNEIGPYRLLQQIGEGGMGTVYMAQQGHPVRRRVALKVIKPGMDSKQVVARFEAERQALSMMDHPNIAHVLGVGTTDNGRPYFVMELIKGLPITDFCDDKRLTLIERLKLFRSICLAVQHAHQKGIIHRDIKPSNILVAEYDNELVPKIIDFGLAKALHQQLTEKTMFTQLGQVVGTYEYMSPEQSKMNQLDVDTRTDIYSLGVLLYELLTGTTPFEKQRLRAAAFDQILKIIREEEPPKPSTRLSTIESSKEIAASRGTEPRSLCGMVRGDLDWIVMKALEKERSRRYETANGLAMDIQRFLNDEPVSATPPSTKYKLNRFVRRNRVPIVTGCIVAAALVFGIIGTSWQAFRATAQRDRALRAEDKAKTEAAISNAVNTFLNEDLLAQASPANQPDRDIKLRTVLDLASDKIEGRFQDQPLVEATIRKTIAEAYYELGIYEKMEHHYRRRATILERELGFDNPATLLSFQRLCSALDRQDKYAENEQIHRRLLRVYDRDYPPQKIDRLRIMDGLANALWARGKVLDAVNLYKEVALIARIEHPTARFTITFLINEAWGIEYLGGYSEAEMQFREVIELIEQVDINEEQKNLLKLEVTQYLARTLWRQDSFEAAEQTYRKVLERQKQLIGASHPDTLQTMSGLASALNSLGKYDEAKVLLDHVVDIQSNAVGPNNFFTLISLKTLGWNLLGRGKNAEAEAGFRDVLARIENKNHDREYLDAQDAMSGLAKALVGQEKNAEAEQLYRELLEIQQRVFGPDHLESKKTRQGLDELLKSKSVNK